MSSPRLVLLLLLGLLAAAEDYRITLDGKPWTGSWISLGDGPHPGPSDLLWVNGWRIPVDEPGDYAFTSGEQTLRLSIGDAPAALVAATISTTWKDDASTLLNPLAGLGRPELAGLRSLRLAATVQDGHAIWTPELLDPEALDWSRLVLDLRVECGERVVPLPEAVTRRIRHLAVDCGSSGGGFSFDLANLATGGTLVYADLEAGGAAPLRGAWLANHRQLRHLAIRGGSLTDPAALASLGSLRHLQLGWLDQPLDLAFASGLHALESVELARCDVASLAPFIGLPRLTTLHASSTTAAVLPARACPALRNLDVVGTRLAPADIAAFAASNPHVRIRHRWIDCLREMAARTEQLTLRTGGTCHRRQDQEKILHQTTDREAITLLAAMIDIDEENSGQHCMCCGECVLEFRASGELIASLGMHHGVSLRWSGADDPWPGDARMTAAASDALCAWLATHGADGPLLQLREARAQEAAAERMLAFYRDILGAALDDLARTDKPDQAKAILAKLWPEAGERTLGLLRLYGCGNRDWSGVFGLDQLAEEGETLPAAAVATVAQRALALPDSSDGLARWCFSLGRLSTLPAEVRTAIGPSLATRALADAHADNRRKTLVYLDACADSWATDALRIALAGIVPRQVAQGEEQAPGGQVVYRPRPWSPPEKAGDRAVAALALARRGDAASLTAIRKLAEQSSGDDRSALDEALRLLEVPKR